MRNDEQRFFTSTGCGEKQATGTAGGSRRRQPVMGVAGRLRPYRDVRSGFDLWRRVALQAWVSREEATTAH